MSGPSPLQAVAGFVAVCLIVVGGIVGGVAAASSHSCSQTGDKLGYETDWGWFTPCMIKVDDRWIPLDRWMNVQDVDALALSAYEPSGPTNCVSRREAVVAGNELLRKFESRVAARPFLIDKDPNVQTRYYRWCPGMGESFGARFKLVVGKGWLLKRAFLSSAQPDDGVPVVP